MNEDPAIERILEAVVVDVSGSLIRLKWLEEKEAMNINHVGFVDGTPILAVLLLQDGYGWHQIAVDPPAIGAILQCKMKAPALARVSQDTRHLRVC
jgi:hypothetical protein